MNKRVFCAILIAALSAGPNIALANEKAPNRTEVKMQTTAEGTGVINSVDANSGQLNLTHGPIPEIGWPTMTMDFAVTRRVDLTTLKPGARISFKLKQGRDKQYRIIEVAPAN